MSFVLVSRSHLSRRGLLGLLFTIGLCGCLQEAASHPLDPEVARSSVQKAMQAWVEGRTPKELQPEIVVGDFSWEQGKKLVSFEILPEEETTDGSNLYIRVKRKFEGNESKVTYIVGTTPVVTIFPQ